MSSDGACIVDAISIKKGAGGNRVTPLAPDNQELSFDCVAHGV